MLTGPRGLFLIAGQEKVVTVDLERVLTAPPVEHLTVHTLACCGASVPRTTKSFRHFERVVLVSTDTSL